jgi:cytochrome b
VQPIRIWDLPTRLFHWGLALGVVGLVVTAKAGAMEWHFRLGYCVLALLLFRLVWGLVGGRWSRFASFIHGPSTLMRYLRGQARPEDSAGHSPTGALAVFALLGVLLAQVGTGLFADDEITFAGPLAKFASGEWVSQASVYHRNIGEILIFTLVGLHVIAIAFYRIVKKERLVRAMVSGDKELKAPVEPSRDDVPARLSALAVFAASAAAVVGLVYWAG